MATRQGLDASIINRLGADHQEIFFAVKAEFDTDDIMLWTGSGDLVIGGDTYVGAGELLTISNSEESSDIRSNGVSLSISGMDTDVLGYALTENYQNRPFTLLMGYLMGGANESAGEVILFRGRMISIVIKDSTNGSTIEVSAENRLLDLQRPSKYRYTKESQNFLYPNDVSLNRIASLQDKEIIWGKTTSNLGGREGDDANAEINYCFTTDMHIAMADGTLKLAGDIKENDSLQSINAQGFTTTELYNYLSDVEVDIFDDCFVDISKVTKAEVIGVPNYYIINEQIKVTGYHPLIVLRNDIYQWVCVRDIRSGDIVVTDKHQLRQVTSLRFVDQKTDVMKISVDNQHNYFGGTPNMLIAGHNK